MSSCSDKIHYKTWLPEHHYQCQRKEFRWSNQRAENIHERWDKAKIESDLAQKKIVWKIDHLENQYTGSSASVKSERD